MSAISASLLQSSVSHDPSEIIQICCFVARETFPAIINAENSCAYYFCGNIILFFTFSGFVESNRDIK